MGLKTDIYNAMVDFYTYGSGPDAQGPDEAKKEKIEKFSKDLETSIKDFILSRLFNIFKVSFTYWSSLFLLESKVIFS